MTISGVRPQYSTQGGHLPRKRTYDLRRRSGTGDTSKASSPGEEIPADRAAGWLNTPVVSHRLHLAFRVAHSAAAPLACKGGDSVQCMGDGAGRREDDNTI